MSFFSRLFSKYNAASDLSKLLKSNNYFLIGQKLEQIDISNFSAEQLEEWYYYRGICELRLNKHFQGIELFRKGLKHIPHSSRLLVAIAQEYEYLEEKDAALSYYQQLNYNNRSSEYYSSALRFMYLHGYYQQAYQQLHDLKEEYHQAIHRDEQKLMDLPPIKQYLINLFVFSYLNKTPIEIKDFMFFEKSLGKQEIKLIATKMQVIMHKKYDLALTLKPEVDEENERANILEQLTSCVFQLKSETYYTRGINLLSRIHIPQDDYPSLAAVQLISKAAFAHQLGLDFEEKAHLDNYFLSYMSLLDPIELFHFDLIDYQEKAKAVYFHKKKNFTFSEE